MIHKNFISINEPCEEGWKNMSISDKGKFCTSCKKHVHDFSSSTIEEIEIAYIESEGDLCGHVPVKMLQEQFYQSEIKQRHFSYLRTFCIAAIFCFGTNLFIIDSAKASVFQNIKSSFFALVSDANKDSISITGVIKEKISRAPIAYANIMVYHNDSLIYRTTTNVNGEYEVKIAKNKYQKVDISAALIGYQEHRMKGISVSADKQIVVDIDLEQEEVMLEGKISMQERVESPKDHKSGKHK